MVNDLILTFSYFLLYEYAMTMKKILVVINDAILMSVFRSWVFRSQKKECLFFAKDGKEAVELIKTGTIDLVVSELSLPEIDGIELMTYISAYYPISKIAFFFPTNIRINLDLLKKLNSFYFIHKPNSLKDFIQFVSVIEAVDFPAKSVADVTIINFLELIAQQKKTCLLAVENELTQEKGLIYFEHGQLYDAVLADFKAEYAVIEILRWQYAKFSFRALANKKFAKQIKLSLASLAVQSSHLSPQDTPLEVIEIVEEEVAVSDNVSIAADVPVDNPPSLQSEMAAELKARFAEAAQIEEETQAMIVIMRTLDISESLSALQKINNYLGFAVFDMTGEVIINDRRGNFEVQIEQISANIAMIVKNVAKILRNTGLKKFDFMQMNFEAAICQASWVMENRFIGIVLLMPDAKNAGLACVHLSKVCESVHNALLPPA